MIAMLLRRLGLALFVALIGMAALERFNPTPPAILVSERTG